MSEWWIDYSLPTPPLAKYEDSLIIMDNEMYTYSVFGRRYEIQVKVNLDTYWSEFQKVSDDSIAHIYLKRDQQLPLEYCGELTQIVVTEWVETDQYESRTIRPAWTVISVLPKGVRKVGMVDRPLQSWSPA